MKLPTPFLSCLAALALVACEGTTPAPATPEPAPAAPAATVASATPAAVPAAFASMTREQKIQHMKAVVAPKMNTLFTAFDAKKYGDFGCKTCHGDKKQDPHVVIAPLTLSGDGFQQLMAAKPVVMKFMSEKVVPEMAAAMGQKPYDHATKQGFGCAGCHRVQ